MSSDDPRHDANQLAAAIGRVAMRSAEADGVLRIVLDELTGKSDITWIIFEGQSTDLLISNIKAILKLSPPAEPLHRGMLNALDAINSLRVQRNVVVHGEWSRDPGPAEEEDILPPWGNLDNDQPVWFSRRSTYRAFGKVAVWTVSDIDLLAAKFSEAMNDVLRAYGRIHHRRHPGWVEHHGPWTPLLNE